MEDLVGHLFGHIWRIYLAIYVVIIWGIYLDIYGGFIWPLYLAIYGGFIWPYMWSLYGEFIWTYMEDLFGHVWRIYFNLSSCRHKFYLFIFLQSNYPSSLPPPSFLSPSTFPLLSLPPSSLLSSPSRPYKKIL